ncbi:MAG: hypothetical protein ABSB35_24925 [Bryobacteraceae bacterium]
MPAPNAPRSILLIGATLAAIVVILTQVSKIQDFLCREGVTRVCAAQFALKIGKWPNDIAGGWQATISNPTNYSAQIVDANLIFQRQIAPPVMIGVTPGPADWQAPSTCAAGEAAIPTVELKPTSTTSLRLMLYAGPQRPTNQRVMAAIDQTIPELQSIPCDLVVSVSGGDGRTYKLHSGFACSRLPGPTCR